MKVMLVTGNSVYFANTFSSVHIDRTHHWNVSGDGKCVLSNSEKTILKVSATQGPDGVGGSTCIDTDL